MKVTKEILDNKKVKLEIHVESETFEESMQKAYLKNRKHISVPGFRKGRVPRKINERYYGEAIFYEDAVNELFPKVYDEAVKQTGIEPVASPTVDIAQIGGGKDLILTAEVDVKPDVELGQYKGIEIEKVEYTVTDEDVEHQLEHIAEDNARWITIENRGIQKGDLITFDYTGMIDGEPFEGGTAEKQTLEVGSGRFIPGFEDQLIGLRQEEEKDITVTFPEDYHVDDLKGKEAVFHVKIHEIKEKELPEIDDEFAKDVSEFATLEEYKADLKRKLQETADQNARDQMENQLLSKIVDAYNRVKTQLVLEALVKAEAIVVTDEDREKEYEKMAEQYKMNVEDIKKTFGTNTEQMDYSIQVQKTIDMLMNEAVIVEKVIDQDKEEKNKEEKGEDSED